MVEPTGIALECLKVRAKVVGVVESYPEIPKPMVQVDPIERAQGFLVLVPLRHAASLLASDTPEAIGAPLSPAG